MTLSNSDIRIRRVLSHLDGATVASPVPPRTYAQHAAVMVVGAMTMDITAIATTSIAPSTTVPGQVNELPGGVARNICDALIRLLPPEDVELVAVVGSDAAALALVDAWRQRGASTAGIRMHVKARTATVALTMHDGEIVAGVADTGIVEEELSSEWITERMHANADCRIVLLDANLHHKTLSTMARDCWQKGRIVVVDPVSVTKAIRCVPCLHYIDVIKPGLQELHAMSCELRRKRNKPPIIPPQSAAACKLLHTSAPADARHIEVLSGALLHVWDLLCEGVGALLLSLGADGCAACQLVHAAEARRRVPLSRLHHHNPQAVLAVVHIPPMPCKPVSTTGAGDCLVAGTLCGLYNGQDLAHAGCIGAAAAHCSCCSTDNVPLALTWEAIQADVDKLGASTVHMLWGIDRAQRRVTPSVPVPLNTEL
eukprot:jgi/Ulvmu1/4079/UM019_0057.1